MKRHIFFVSSLLLLLSCSSAIVAPAIAAPGIAAQPPNPAISDPTLSSVNDETVFSSNELSTQNRRLLTRKPGNPSFDFENQDTEMLLPGSCFQLLRWNVLQDEQMKDCD
jgi:hypothetical protein